MGLTLTDRQDVELSRLLAHMSAVREHWPSIVWCKDALARDDKWAFLEAWQELSHEVQVALWVAPSKGGVWTTAERKQMREWWGNG